MKLTNQAFQLYSTLVYLQDVAMREVRGFERLDYHRLFNLRRQAYNRYLRRQRYGL